MLVCSYMSIYLERVQSFSIHVFSRLVLYQSLKVVQISIGNCVKKFDIHYQLFLTLFAKETLIQNIFYSIIVQTTLLHVLLFHVFTVFLFRAKHSMGHQVVTYSNNIVFLFFISKTEC